MNLDTHFALRTGLAPMPEGRDALLSIVDLGILRVQSGKLGAADPFVLLGSPVVVSIPPGDYPVRVTIADVSEHHDGSHFREAYLSVVVSDAEPASVELAPGPDGPPSPGFFYGLAVDAGAVAFFDAAAVADGMPEDPATWYESIFDTGRPDSWLSLIQSDSPQRKGTANVVMPRATAGENIVIALSGWGDGFYPMQQTRDVKGRLVAVHIDLEVVGVFENEVASALEVTPSNDPRRRRGWFARLFRGSQ